MILVKFYIIVRAFRVEAIKKEKNIVMELKRKEED